jgi:hypothetical protein
VGSVSLLLIRLRSFIQFSGYCPIGCGGDRQPSRARAVTNQPANAVQYGAVLAALNSGGMID